MDWPLAIAKGWHPVAFVDEIGAKPVAARLMGRALVVFRSAEPGGFGVLVDRCPHRAAPLSKGRVEAGAIVCPYHGWRFASDGRCLGVPGATESPAVAASATALPVRVEAGLVWTSLHAEPAPFPDLPPAMTDATLDRFWWRLAPSRAGLLDALENHLDPAHPHFVHPWLVRAPTRRRPVTVEIRTGPWGAEARYIEERANLAFLPSVMEGQRAASIGRLWPPTIGEVRLESARGASLSIAVVFSPLDHDLTRPFAHFASTRGRLPGWFKRGALKLFHLPVLAQDRRLLAWQADLRGDAGYKMGPLDVLAPAIWQFANDKPCAEQNRTITLDL